MADTPFEFTAEYIKGRPIIEVEFSVGTTKTGALKAAGRKVPDQVVRACYLDTGCSRTAVDYSVVQSLALKSTGSTSFHTARGLQFGETCVLDLSIAGEFFNDLECAYFGNLMTDHYAVLLGLDVLKKFVLELDGGGSRLTLRHSTIPHQEAEGESWFDGNSDRFNRRNGGGWLHYGNCANCGVIEQMRRKNAARSSAQGR
jgi:hypothetical protein